MRTTDLRSVFTVEEGEAPDVVPNNGTRKILKEMRQNKGREKPSHIIFIGEGVYSRKKNIKK